MKFLIT